MCSFLLRMRYIWFYFHQWLNFIQRSYIIFLSKKDKNYALEANVMYAYFS